MKIGCCIGIEYYDTLASLGFDSIALAGVDVAAWSDAQFAAALAKLRSGALETISLNSFCPASLRLTGPDTDLQAVRAYTKHLCGRAAKMGVRYIGIGAPKSRSFGPESSYAAAWSELGASIRAICEEAQPFGIDILMESVCSLECNLITTTEEALRFLCELDVANLHLVYDIYHEFMEKQPPSVIEEAASEIRVVHLAENVDDSRHYLDPAHTDDYRRYFNALAAAGYEGEFNLEAMRGDPMKELPVSMNILQKIKES